MSRNAAKKLYTAIVAAPPSEALEKEAAIATDPNGFEAIAESVLDRLSALETQLTRAREAASRAGDTTLAQAIRPVLNRVKLLLISIDQELIRFLDSARDVAKAQEKIEGINAALQAETDRLADKVEGLERTGAVLDQLAKLGGLLAKPA
jgi:hypothetical protein